MSWQVASYQALPGTDRVALYAEALGGTIGGVDLGAGSEAWMGPAWGPRQAEPLYLLTVVWDDEQSRGPGKIAGWVQREGSQAKTKEAALAGLVGSTVGGYALAARELEADRVAKGGTAAEYPAAKTLDVAASDAKVVR